MNKVSEIRYDGDYRFWVQFNDGESKVIDFKDFIEKGVSEELRDIDYFKLARIDNGGGIEWPNGFDFCPNYLKELPPIPLLLPFIASYEGPKR